MLAVRGESPAPILDWLRLEAADVEKSLRTKLRRTPATPDSWAALQMEQGAFEALNRVYLRLHDLFYPPPPRKPLPPSAI